MILYHGSREVVEYPEIRWATRTCKVQSSDASD